MTVQTYRFYEPNGEHYEGWYVAFIDSTGCLAVLSDYGDYSYRWSAPEGTGQEFRRFLLRCNDSYILGKIAPKREYDPEATEKAIQAHIHENIACDCEDGDPVKADEERTLLAHADLTNEWGFFHWAQDTEIETPTELFRQRTSPQAVAFMERVWPRLMAKVRESLDAEKAEAAPA